MRLKAVPQLGGAWRITTPTGEDIEGIQSIVEGYLHTTGPYLSVHIRVPLDGRVPVTRPEPAPEPPLHLEQESEAQPS